MFPPVQYFGQIFCQRNPGDVVTPCLACGLAYDPFPAGKPVVDTLSIHSGNRTGGDERNDLVDSKFGPLLQDQIDLVSLWKPLVEGDTRSGDGRELGWCVAKLGDQGVRLDRPDSGEFLASRAVCQDYLGSGFETQDGGHVMKRFAGDGNAAACECFGG